MLPAQMMTLPLSITSVMTFAEKAHADSEIVSVTYDNHCHRYTYRDAFRRVRKLANALSEAGVEPGDRVATLAWNDHRHFELYYAIPCMGAVCHTINPRLFTEQVEYIVNHAKNELLFVDPVFLPLVETLMESDTSLKQVVLLTDMNNVPETTLRNVIDYETFIDTQPEVFEWPEIDENSASGLCYTSGTTGNPKGVLYSHRSSLLHAYAAITPDVMCLSSHDVVLPIVPMFHVNAWSLPYAAPMVGCKLVLPGSQMGDSETLQHLIEQEGVTISAGVPTIWLALLDYLRTHKKSVESLNRVVVGGAACPLSIMDEFETLHGVKTLQGWGMTETSPLGVFNTLKAGMCDLPKEKLDTVRVKQGRPIFGVDIRIVDEKGNEQPWDGESTGEVQVKGNWVCHSYYKQEDSSPVDKDGYFPTGDVASIDSQGYMRITDRIKDVIKSGGEWISSIDLENAAMSHPAVAEAAVIGVPHSRWTERPLLVVKMAANQEACRDEILSSLEGKVAKWWIPDDIQFVEDIPHTATGKISKKDLRVQFADYSAG
ncbi:MAG: long-chain fatty acid--CoA ligase [Cellvibrionaceae bacterium]|nr:long-chain fatty acid--CoA ligase [Cellvibrionaceae bacterium]|tara:strand:- start:815 stop:2443 length:1629 start_codon:yes stop_codon:yes gene_type:complete